MNGKERNHGNGIEPNPNPRPSVQIPGIPLQKLGDGPTCFVANLPYCQSMSAGKKSDKKAVLLGVGLDSDGKKRVTTGKNFALIGGTQETHEAMTETAIKLNEKLARKGKELHQVSGAELEDLAHEVGLKRLQGPNPESN